jgi:hypothetical protein
MSDKQSRFSHVNIVESSDARVVVHWRYALAEPENYLGANADPLTQWFDWADEYWTVYPDGVAIRKQVLRPSDQTQKYEWQETIVVHQPGRSPDDDINPDAITIANMKGEAATYTWQPRTIGTYGDLHMPQAMDRPDNPNIQWVNLKSAWKPFEIVSPAHSRVVPFRVAKSWFSFPCWNHWPVTQIPSSGRYCVAPDRASHTSLSHIFWDSSASDEGSITKILMDGLTKNSAAALLPLAQSWVSPPALSIASTDYRNEGYDPSQRAYVVSKLTATKPSTLIINLKPSTDSPVVNPAIVIRGWGSAEARIKIDGKPVAWNADCRNGVERTLDSTDLVVWLRKTSAVPLQIALSAE